ncbi:cupin domain-containing protein [Aliikangiella coralliicola]|uniref:Cupin domain-containing protein n=1 Tax=Aliikangiella coralliicola TaxID=2592383 RepID=A0A545TWA4_9GAMM|nr:cupin domain-containing protein [Aliikangiella coralliicola]TQV81503.1 cupin domain-containing protein [Aliikangiella coralliicola]
MKFDLTKIEKQIDEAWTSGNFVKQLSTEEIPNIPTGIELSKWECMILSKIYCKPGDVGELVLAFPPGGSPAELVPHTHGGGRVITIVAGVGLFQVMRDGQWVDIELKPGVQVMFPKETLHTFIGVDDEALLAHALHAPFLEPSHPRAIVYDDGTREKHYDDWDPREYFPEILGEPNEPLSLVCSTSAA